MSAESPPGREGENPDISRLVRTAAEQVPQRIALVESSGRSLTWAELEDQVARFATALGPLGVLAGHRVMLCSENRLEFVIGYLGVLRAQAVAVPVNPRSSEDEMVRMIADSGSRLILADADRLALVRGAVARIGSALDGRTHARDAALADTEAFIELLARAVRPRVVAISGEPQSSESGWADLVAGEPGETPPLLDPEKLAVLLYTSGTSGRPRAAMLTHRALLANLAQVAAVEPPMMHGDDVVLGVLPLFHVYGLNAVLGGILWHRARLVLVEHFDPTTVLDLIEDEAISVVPVAPPVFRDWLTQPDLAERFGPVRLVLSGSAPLSAEVIERFTDLTGVPLHQGYGLTEASPVVTSTLCSADLETGSVGAVLPGVELQLVDERNGQPEGEDPGEIRIRGANLFSGYWPDGVDGPDQEGWWNTGDVGFLNGADNLFLVDRVRDLIVVSGFNVYPVEVEEVIGELDGVAETAVVGAVDEVTGEAVVAYLLPTQPDLSESARAALIAEVRGHCATRLARFKQPTRLEIVETLPRSVTGKVQKGRLRGIERRRHLGLLD